MTNYFVFTVAGLTSAAAARYDITFPSSTGFAWSLFAYKRVTMTTEAAQHGLQCKGKQ